MSFNVNKLIFTQAAGGVESMPVGNGEAKVQSLTEAKSFGYSSALNTASVGEIQSVFLPPEFMPTCPNVQTLEVARYVVGMVA